jgi:CheY-like chemotaxis protein
MKDTTVDIILTDVYMPDMDGIELMLRVYRAHASLRTIVIVISGGGVRPMDETLEAARASGAFRTVAKPFTREEILEAVDAAVAELDPGGGKTTGTQANEVG